MSRVERLKRQVNEAGVPLRELSRLSKNFIRTGVAYYRISDGLNECVKLSDAEIDALETALALALQTRVDHFSRLLSEYPLQQATA